MRHRLSQIFFTGLIFFTFFLVAKGMSSDEFEGGYEQVSSDSFISLDTVINSDTVSKPDTLKMVDSLDISKDAIEQPIHYEAEDSIYINIKKKKVYLYNQSKIDYDKISVEAYHVDIDFPTKILKAYGIKDSLNKWEGKPKFKDGDKEFFSELMQYNFETKIGRSNSVITKEGEGYLHGDIIKKLPDNTINIRKGRYTTCELEHPHFQLELTKAKVMPNDKIVSGPAYLVVEDVPLPIVLPFGFFPNKKGRSSGIIIPKYGEGSNNRGFFFENGGYYWGISDKMDFQLLGDIYTRGSWALEPTFRYYNRYRFRGSFSGGYAVNILGEEGTPNYKKSKDINIRWTHRQDPKARPNSTFNANVNIVTSTYNQYNPVNANNYLSNTFQSSIAYQTNIRKKIFINLGANHQQNTLQKTVNVTLPQLTVTTNKFFPFRFGKRQGAGKLKWYENISVGYTLDAKNQLNTYDSLMTFDQAMWERFNNGVKQVIPINSNIKLLKYFTWTNNINFTERWYAKGYKQHMELVQNENGEMVASDVIKTPENAFKAIHEFSVSSSISTRLYGMYSFRKGPVKAIRHVITPNVGFSYRPDYGDSRYGYYQTYTNPVTQQIVQYSPYQSAVYGVPGAGKMGSVNFNLSNNFEMKVKSKSDTLKGYKKIKLIDNLSFSTSYNLAADSLNWSVLSINGRTRLFDKLDVTYRSIYDPYQINDKGQRINKFVWEKDKRLFRRENTSWTFGFSYQLNQSDVKKWKYGDETPPENENENNDLLFPNDYVKWDNNWNFGINYLLTYTNKFQKLQDKYERDFIQTLDFNGSISITDKWKIDARSGYDFKQKSQLDSLWRI